MNEVDHFSLKDTNTNNQVTSESQMVSLSPKAIVKPIESKSVVKEPIKKKPKPVLTFSHRNTKSQNSSLNQWLSKEC